MKTFIALLSSLLLAPSALAAWVLSGVGTAVYDADSGDVTCTAPAHSNGDTLIAFASITTSSTWGANFVTEMSGTWTRILDDAFGASAFAKIGDGSESPVFQFAGGGATQTTGCIITAWTGGPTTVTGIVHVSDVNTDAVGSDTNIGFDAMTITASNALVIDFKGNRQQVSGTASSGYTELFDVPTALGADYGLWAQYQIQTTPTSAVSHNATWSSSGVDYGGSIALLPAVPAGIALQEHVAFGEGTVMDTVIDAPAFNLAAGNLLIVCARSLDTINSISDTAGNTFTALTQISNSTSNARLRIFYAYNTLAHASNVVSVTFGSTNDYRWVAMAEVSGAKTSSDVLDVELTGLDGAMPANIISSPALTTTNANDFIFMCVTQVGPSIYTAGTGYTLLDGTITTGAIDYGGDQYKITLAPISSVAQTFGSTNDTNEAVVAIAAFEEATSSTIIPKVYHHRQNKH